MLALMDQTDQFATTVRAPRRPPAPVPALGPAASPLGGPVQFVPARGDLFLDGDAASHAFEVIDGIVCAASEAAAVRRAAGPDCLIVTPGIRPRGAATGDQKRVYTPGAAIAEGADFLVVGRPITTSPDPRAAALSVVDEITAALRPGTGGAG